MSFAPWLSGELDDNEWSMLGLFRAKIVPKRIRNLCSFIICRHRYASFNSLGTNLVLMSYVPTYGSTLKHRVS
jgi:hypothetical protein